MWISLEPTEVTLVVTTVGTWSRSENRFGSFDQIRQPNEKPAPTGLNQTTPGFEALLSPSARKLAV